MLQLSYVQHFQQIALASGIRLIPFSSATCIRETECWAKNKAPFESKEFEVP
jgi:hypothetical protein